MKKTIAVLLLLAFCRGIFALDFEKCLRLAEENNRDYKIAKQELEIAAADLRIAAGRFAPSLSFKGGLSPLVKPATVEIPAGILGPQALSMPMSTQPAWSARVSLSQPVFTFGKLETAFLIQREAYEIAQLNFKRAGEKLKLDVISAFYGVLIAGELKTINEEALKRTEENLRITKKKFESGEVPKLELLRAQVEASNMVPEAARSGTLHRLAVKNLASTLGMPADKVPEPEGEVKYEKLRLTYDEAKRLFEKNNDEKKIAAKLTKINAKKAVLSAAMALPSIGLDAGVNYYTFDNDFRADKGIWETSWDVSIGFSWTFFDGFRNVNEAVKAFAGYEKQGIEEEKANDGLLMQFEKLYSTLEENSAVIEAADITIKTAEEGYKAAKESYMNGLARPIDLLDAELGLKKSRINYLNALYSYTTAVREFKNFIE